MLGKNKLVLWALLMSGMLAACQTDTRPQAFRGHGVSFAYPADWTCGEAEKLPGNAFSLNCEKNGFDSSGLVTMSWFADSLELPELQEIFRAQLKENPIYRAADLSLGPVAEGRFGRYATLTTPYAFKLIGIAHTGHIHAFHGPNKSVVVMMQQATEDSTKNRAGLAAIEQSFRTEAAK